MSKLAASPELATDAALDELLGGWGAIEGTIKQNEVDMYLSFEDALAAFTKAGKAKDVAAMAAAAAAFAYDGQGLPGEAPVMARRVTRVLGFLAVVAVALLAAAELGDVGCRGGHRRGEP